MLYECPLSIDCEAPLAASSIPQRDSLVLVGSNAMATSALTIIGVLVAVESRPQAEASTRQRRNEWST